MANAVTIIAALTALVAVLLGPLVSLWAANKQSRIAVLSQNRQAWISTLRDALAEFVSTARVVTLAQEFEDRYVRVEKMVFLETKVLLLLNHSEQDHKELSDSLQIARVCAVRSFAAGDDKEQKKLAVNEVINTLGRITELARPILKREWERVKKAI